MRITDMKIIWGIFVFVAVFGWISMGLTVYNELRATDIHFFYIFATMFAYVSTTIQMIYGWLTS